MRKSASTLLPLSMLVSVALGCIQLAPLAVAKETSSDKAKHLPVTSHHQVSMKKYKGTQVSFSYPSAWLEKEKDSDETLTKFAGDITNGVPGEITVSLNKTKNLDADALKTIVNAYFKSLDDFKTIQESKIRFGRTRSIEGLLQDTSFSMKGLKMFQRLVFFEGPKGVYSCSFLTTDNVSKKAVPSFNRILMSFSFNNGVRINSASVTKKETAHIRAKHVPISFSYPNGWQVKQTTGDQALEISGKDKSGNPATISIFKGRMHPYMNLGQVAQSLEDEHLAARDKYRRLSSQSRTFGSMAKIHGIVQECKFESNGVKYNQLVAYFNDDSHAYVISMASPKWKLSEMRRTFHKVLASMKMKH